MEDKDIYGFWFFGWNPLSFSMWLVFVWDNRVRGFNDKGQSFLVEFFTDIHFSPIFWLLICDLFVILQSLFMKMWKNFTCSMAVRQRFGSVVLATNLIV